MGIYPPAAYIPTTGCHGYDKAPNKILVITIYTTIEIRAQFRVGVSQRLVGYLMHCVINWVIHPQMFWPLDFVQVATVSLRIYRSVPKVTNALVNVSFGYKLLFSPVLMMT